MQYSDITEALPEKKISIEKIMKQARIPGVCQATVDKNGVFAIPYGYAAGYGLLKMASDPTEIPFEDLGFKILELQDAIILYQNELFFADQKMGQVKKIDVSGLNPTAVEELKNACSSSYRLADEKEVQLIASITGQPLPEKIKPTTVFGAASLSKVVLAFIVLKLISSGKFIHNGKLFSLQTKLNEILPFETFYQQNQNIFKWEKQKGDDDRLAQLTVEMALSHKTGLNIDRYYPADFEAEPDKEYVYSGLGIFYLQKVIEQLTQQPLDALARELVFGPNKMTHSSFYPDYDLAPMTEEERKSGVIYLEQTEKGLFYEVIGMKKKQVIPWEWLPANFPRDVPNILKAKDQLLPILLDHTSWARHTPDAIAALSLRTTAEDYGRFVKAWMTSEDKVLRDAFSRRIYMIDDQWALGIGVPQDDLKHVGWGLGWGLELDDEGKPIRAYHSGDMNKHRAWVVINLNDNPEDNTATIYFANSINGHILADPIISPNSELEHALNYFFKKYGFSRTLDELPAEQKRMDAMDRFLEERRKERLGQRVSTFNEQTKPADDQSLDNLPKYR